MNKETSNPATFEKLELSIMRDSGPFKLTMRWPTDEEWAKRHKSRRLIQRDMGRGMSESEPIDNKEFDKTLVREISGDDTVTPAEATTVLNRLASSNITGLERTEEGFLVRIRTVGNLEMEIKTKCPSTELSAEYKRKLVRIINLQFGQQEFRTNLQCAADLFESIHIPNGEGRVAIIHKADIAAAVVTESDRILEGYTPTDESF